MVSQNVKTWLLGDLVFSYIYISNSDLDVNFTVDDDGEKLWGKKSREEKKIFVVLPLWIFLARKNMNNKGDYVLRQRRTEKVFLLLVSSSECLTSVGIWSSSFQV